MDDILGALAFALLIGGQFLAVIVVTAKRDTIFANPNERVDRPAWQTDESPRVVQVRHRTVPGIAMALAQQSATRRPDGADDPVPASASITSSPHSTGRPARANPSMLGFHRGANRASEHGVPQSPSASVRR